LTGAKYHTSAQAIIKPIIWQTSGLNVYRYHQEFSERKHREVNKRKQNFEFQQTRSACNSELKG
jgi:hypothetical protein